MGRVFWRIRDKERLAQDQPPSRPCGRTPPKGRIKGSPLARGVDAKRTGCRKRKRNEYLAYNPSKVLCHAERSVSIQSDFRRFAPWILTLRFTSLRMTLVFNKTPSLSCAGAQSTPPMEGNCDTPSPTVHPSSQRGTRVRSCLNAGSPPAEGNKKIPPLGRCFFKIYFLSTLTGCTSFVSVVGAGCSVVAGACSVINSLRRSD